MAFEKIERTKHKVVSKQTSTITSLVSGTENPFSLKCVFYVIDNGDLVTRFSLNHWYQGHENIAHGGACYAVMDEIMGRANAAYNEMHNLGYTPVVTGEITCRYISPAPLFETLYAYGRVDSVDGRKRFTSGEVVTEDGRVLVKCKGVFFQVNYIPNDDGHEAGTPLDENDPEEI